jgi:hypothetical protein
MPSPAAQPRPRFVSWRHRSALCRFRVRSPATPRKRACTPRGATDGRLVGHSWVAVPAMPRGRPLTRLVVDAPSEPTPGRAHGPHPIASPRGALRVGASISKYFRGMEPLPRDRRRAQDEQGDRQRQREENNRDPYARGGLDGRFGGRSVVTPGGSDTISAYRGSGASVARGDARGSSVVSRRAAGARQAALSAAGIAVGVAVLRTDVRASHAADHGTRRALPTRRFASRPAVVAGTTRDADESDQSERDSHSFHDRPDLELRVPATAFSFPPRSNGEPEQSPPSAPPNSANGKHPSPAITATAKGTASVAASVHTGVRFVVSSAARTAVRHVGLLVHNPARRRGVARRNHVRDGVLSRLALGAMASPNAGVKKVLFDARDVIAFRKGYADSRPIRHSAGRSVRREVRVDGFSYSNHPRLALPARAVRRRKHQDHRYRSHDATVAAPTSGGAV